METYLSLLVHKKESLELNQWLPTLLEQHFKVKITPGQVSTHPDIHLVNLDNEALKIEQVRDLQALSGFTPYQLAQSFFVIQDIETASAAAQNALLKILEEPPKGVQLILTTTHPDQILATIKSRCQVIELGTTSQTRSHDPETPTLYQLILDQTAGEAVTLAEKYTDRAQAQAVITSLISFLHQELENQTQTSELAQQVRHLETLLQAHDWLEKNANVKLALTECFFQLNTKKPILRP